MAFDDRAYNHLLAGNVFLSIFSILFTVALAPSLADSLLSEHSIVESVTAIAYLFCVAALFLKRIGNIWDRIFASLILFVFVARELELKQFFGIDAVTLSYFFDSDQSVIGRIAVLALLGAVAFGALFLCIRNWRTVFQGLVNGRAFAIGFVLGIFLLCLSQALDKLSSLSANPHEGAGFVFSVSEEILELAVPFIFATAIFAPRPAGEPDTFYTHASP